MHVTSADRPQPDASRALPRREDHERIARVLSAADCEEARFASSVFWIRSYEGLGVHEDMLDFGD
jgi:hypothetical protein